MKLLLILALVLAGVWWWRNQRKGSDRTRTPAPGPRQTPAAAQQDILACPVCQLHVARSDAVTGRQGAAYCSEEHRRQAEP